VPKQLQLPKIGIVCGSGLSGLADRMREEVLVPYEDLKGFSESTVSGHMSALAFGLLGNGEGVPVIAMLGRVSLESTVSQPASCARWTKSRVSSV
jgi:purine-nucleoside phosphorylase